MLIALLVIIVATPVVLNAPGPSDPVYPSTPASGLMVSRKNEYGEDEYPLLEFYVFGLSPWGFGKTIVTRVGTYYLVDQVVMENINEWAYNVDSGMTAVEMSVEDFELELDIGAGGSTKTVRIGDIVTIEGQKVEIVDSGERDPHGYPIVHAIPIEDPSVVDLGNNTNNVPNTFNWLPLLGAFLFVWYLNKRYKFAI